MMSALLEKAASTLHPDYFRRRGLGRPLYRPARRHARSGIVCRNLSGTRATAFRRLH